MFFRFFIFNEIGLTPDIQEQFRKLQFLDTLVQEKVQIC